MLKDIISANAANIAFLVGNGINNFNADPAVLSWESMLEMIREENGGEPIRREDGITNTEYFDLLVLRGLYEDKLKTRYTKEICKQLDEWRVRDHHRAFMKWAQNYNTPVLTTNYDLLLPRAVGLNRYQSEKGKFTAIYPWKTHYGRKQVDDLLSECAVWFVNGLIDYHQSIRLGLSDYAGLIERARPYLHRGSTSLFSHGDLEKWGARKTWLQIIFGKSLCIIGLSMDRDEVFLRWLLIERARYIKKYHIESLRGWYALVPPSKPEMNETDMRIVNRYNEYLGKKKYFQGIGFDVVEVKHWKDVYELPWQSDL